MTITPSKVFKGTPTIPGDKSISHRSLIFGALARGQTTIFDLLDSADVRSTAQCLRQLGVEIQTEGNQTIVTGKGGLFDAPKEPLDCGNSGTTMRLMMGVLAGQKFESQMIGDVSLSKRPMKRVASPLELMGAQFELTQGNFAPLKVLGQSLSGVSYDLPVASAQIKSALMLAGLQARGQTILGGKIQSRDHTERMLQYFGVKVDVSSEKVQITGGQFLEAKPVQVPGDPSTAAFWMAGACLIEGGSISMKNISLNPTRIGFIKVLQRMGAQITIEETGNNPEPIGTIHVKHGPIKGTDVGVEEVPDLIDEIPILAVVAAKAQGTTTVSGAEELRVKESDRLEAIGKNLRAMGVAIDLKPDGFVIQGGQDFTGATIETFHDHRIAMAFSIAGLLAQGNTTIMDGEIAGVSYPKFFDHLQELTS